MTDDTSAERRIRKRMRRNSPANEQLYPTADLPIRDVSRAEWDDILSDLHLTDHGASSEE